ncbi:N-terminal phage integrase SAM-like domain-containing protein [Nonomuraea fuscirosea]|uniref:N-terminal phage integrase SAM-like domain-containing protein n=1 Tax=Nonomuraea fuscirosea TaxID=1291556 RepID=UPI0015E780F5
MLATLKDGPIGAEATVGQWLRHWLATHQRLRPTTRKAYEDHLRLYLLPHLGHVRLTDLSGWHVRRMLTILAARKNHYGDPIRTSTLERIRATLRTALSTAPPGRPDPRQPGQGDLADPCRASPAVCRGVDRGSGRSVAQCRRTSRRGRVASRSPGHLPGLRPPGSAVRTVVAAAWGGRGAALGGHRPRPRRV